MSLPNDTSPEAERVLMESLRRLPMRRKWLQMGELWNTAKALHAAGFRMRQPDATPQQIQQDWAANMLGPKLLREIEEARGGAGS